ncbi:metalloproteinase inhibitor 3-like isoform X1 [Carassius gibelio]|uniref:metalloproteinase inhibitor 3-like isoform X1 n=1 Tax=Carassius gibelio TaxID=101364 RepID=UPI002278C1BF|nr:metalloproteinase inhibitor 3-like isoform X1 [Carassius gibelio]
MSAAVTLALLFFLSVTLNEQVTEGCTCLPRHPQQHFCTSDTVIRARVIGKVNSHLPQLDAYKIQTIEKFKPLDKKAIPVIYSSQTSCGISLQNDEYLLAGSIHDGRLNLNLCDLVKPWKKLSQTQKLYLRMYQNGCVCEISPCTGASCLIKMVQKKCLIRAKDLFTFDDDKALQSICLPESGGADVCKWRKLRN